VSRPVYSDTILAGFVIDTGQINTETPPPGVVRVIKYVSMIDKEPAVGHQAQALWISGEDQIVVAQTPYYYVPEGCSPCGLRNFTSWWGEVRVVILPDQVFELSSVSGNYDCYASGYYLTAS